MDVNSEQLAKYVANSESKDINLGPPPPPKKGELIYLDSLYIFVIII